MRTAKNFESELEQAVKDAYPGGCLYASKDIWSLVHLYSLSKDAEDLNTVKQLQPLHKFTQQNLLNKINGLYVEKQMKPFKKSKGSQKRSKQTLKKQFNNKMNEYSSIEPNPVDICK